MISRLFPKTQRHGFRDWREYVTCRVFGHRLSPYLGTYCERCGDTMDPTRGRYQP